jgi:CubicO group peptidase (beta-lactamase class C family)
MKMIRVGAVLLTFCGAAVCLGAQAQNVSAADAPLRDASVEQRVEALVPSLEDYIATNMKRFDVPGLAIGIVAGDRLIYAKGFGVRGKGGRRSTRRLFSRSGRQPRPSSSRRWRSPSIRESFTGTTA